MPHHCPFTETTSGEPSFSVKCAMKILKTYEAEYGVPMSDEYRALVGQLRPPVEESFMAVYSTEFQRTYDWGFR